jgi:hypothetical protein
MAMLATCFGHVVMAPPPAPAYRPPRAEREMSSPYAALVSLRASEPPTNLNSTLFMRNMIKHVAGAFDSSFGRHIDLMTTVVNTYRSSAGIVRRTRGRIPHTRGADVVVLLDISKADRLKITACESRMQREVLTGVLAGLCVRAGWSPGEVRHLAKASLQRLQIAQLERPDGATAIPRSVFAGSIASRVFGGQACVASRRACMEAVLLEVRAHLGDMSTPRFCDRLIVFMTDILVKREVDADTLRGWIEDEMGMVKGVKQVRYSAATCTAQPRAAASDPVDELDDLDDLM